MSWYGDSPSDLDYDESYIMNPNKYGAPTRGSYHRFSGPYDNDGNYIPETTPTIPVYTTTHLRDSVDHLRKFMVMCAYLHWTYGVDDTTKRFMMMDLTDRADPELVSIPRPETPRAIVPEVVERIELEMD